ncbi:hypothetical protein DRP05_07595 [Archaeoglobales archaeon]|nr:MAG: hypothetical protein DRP05_07595 [Archaeoglobales archaeon]
MKIGIIVNPKAGDINELRIREVIQRLNPEEIHAGIGDLGEKYLKTSKIKVVKVKRTYSREETIELMKILDGLNLDLIAVFGGDGTMADVALAKPKTPLLCIGMGTTNVSPVLCPIDFNFNELRETRIDGLLLRVNKTERIAFNDVVIGSTILATIDGKKVQVDAERFIRGGKVITMPRKFYGVVDGLKRIEGYFGNIFVALTDKRFLGKGIAGGASLSAFLGFKAVVACVSEPIVVSTYTKEDLTSVEPIVTKTISFDDEVRIKANEVISCDGNPVKKLNDEVAEVKVVENVVRVLKP